MNPTKIRSLLFTAILIMFSFTLLPGTLSQESAEQLYEAALFKKEAEGDLDGAIKILQKIIAEFPENRKMAAKAQFQIGICYEKLGLKEAQNAFQKVVDNYPEQTEMVNVAKQKLSRLLRAKTVIEKGDKKFRIRQVWAGPDVDIFGAPSPDGRYLSYVDWETGDLAIYELPTGKKSRLTNEAIPEDPKEFALYSKISPDSKLVAYSWFNPRGTYDLRLIGIDGSAPRLIYSDEDYEVQPAGWSSNGKKIAVKRYSKKDKTYQILWASVADSSFDVLKTMGKGQTYQDCVSHSPDDRYIAFDFPVEEDSGNYDINLLATDGGGELPLIDHPANDKLLGWAPGREEILFLSDRTGTWDAFVIQVEEGKPQGSPKKIKSEIGKVIPMGFTQDGSFYFSMYTRWFYICIATIDLTKGKLQTLLQHPVVGSSFCPDWSFDGESLAYISEHITPEGPGFFEHILHIRSLKTGEDRVLQCELKRFWNPRWSPDGRSILVTGVAKKNKQKKSLGGLFRINIQNGHVTALVKYDSSHLQDGSWNRVSGEWSPDGKAIFYKVHNRILRREIESQQEKEIYHSPNLLITEKYWRSMALSPDGQRLVFGLREPEKDYDSLIVIPISGGDPQELLRLPETENILKIAWAPEGKYVLFTKGEKKGISLWRISPEGEDPQKLWQSEKDLIGLRVHPDGQKLAFYTFEMDLEVWVMENFLSEVKENN